MRIIRSLVFAVFMGAVYPHSTGAQDLVLDAAQWGQTNIVVRQSGGGSLESIVSKNANHERLAGYPSDDTLRQLSRPVGRLDVQFANGEWVTCTATIVEESSILTNYHCVPNTTPNILKYGRIIHAALVMNYYDETRTSTVQRYIVNVNPLSSDSARDFSYLSVEGLPGRDYGVATIGVDPPKPGASLLVIHHPGGLPKHVTRGGCRAAFPVSTDDSNVQLFHLCDTLPGSSGAPIFSKNAMVGIHRAGATVKGPGAVNYGVLMAALMNEDINFVTTIPQTLPGPTESKVRKTVKLYESTGELHLGDENIRSWSALVGKCLKIELGSNRDLIDATMSFKAYGAENTSIVVGDRITPFYNQRINPGKTRPNYWSDEISIVIPLNNSSLPLNSLRVCGDVVQNPEHPGDLDDFMIKDISLIGSYYE